jgi:hypothetical protein
MSSSVGAIWLTPPLGISQNPSIICTPTFDQPWGWPHFYALWLYGHSVTTVIIAPQLTMIRDLTTLSPQPARPAHTLLAMHPALSPSATQMLW